MQGDGLPCNYFMKNFKIITKNRKQIESLVLGGFLSNLDFYGTYNKISDKDFRIEEIKFFFNIAKTISKKYKELDEFSIMELISGNKESKIKYEKYGGWDAIEEYIDNSNPNNIDAYIDNLAKNNYLLYLDEKGIDLVEEIEIEGTMISPLDLFSTWTCAEVGAFYEGIVAKGEVQSINKKYKRESLLFSDEEIINLQDKVEAGTPYNVIFEYTDKEIGMGDSEEPRYIYGLPLTSNKTSGMGKGGGVSFIAGYSGIGKSTLTFIDIILPLIYQGEKIVMFSNEQGSLYFKTILYSFVAYNVFGYKNLRRSDIVNGEFDAESLEIMKKVKKFLQDREYDELLTFYELEDFDISEILKVATSLVTHEGYTGILVDTFKSEDMADAQYVGKILENAKQIDKFGNKYKILTFLTMQLTPATTDKNAYLTVGELSECKAIVTVADLLFLVRRVINDLELDEKNKKYYLNPYRLKYNEVTEEYEREYIQFDEEDLKKDYRLVFLTKSRRGGDGMIILLRFNGTTGWFKEIGYVSHVYRGPLSY